MTTKPNKTKQTKKPKVFNKPPKTKKQIAQKWITKKVQNLGTNFVINNVLKTRPTRFNHHEMILEFEGSVSFAVDVFKINPCNANAFPWLHGLAGSFEYYIIHSLTIYYVPNCAATAPGSVSLAFCYDTTTTAPTSSVAMLNYAGATTGKIAEALALEIKVDNKRRYNQAGDVPLNNRDPAMIWLGQLWMATEKCASTDAIGKIMIEYDVEFINPVTDDQNEENDVVNTLQSNVYTRVANMFVKLAESAVYELVDGGINAIFQLLEVYSKPETLSTYAAIEFPRGGVYEIRLDLTMQSEADPHVVRDDFHWIPLANGPAVVENVFDGPELNVGIEGHVDWKHISVVSHVYCPVNGCIIGWADHVSGGAYIHSAHCTVREARVDVSDFKKYVKQPLPEVAYYKRRKLPLPDVIVEKPVEKLKKK